MAERTLQRLIEFAEEELAVRDPLYAKRTLDPRVWPLSNMGKRLAAVGLLHSTVATARRPLPTPEATAAKADTFVAGVVLMLVQRAEKTSIEETAVPRNHLVDLTEKNMGLESRRRQRMINHGQKQQLGEFDGGRPK